MKHSASLAIREMQIKLTLHSSHWQTLESGAIPRAGRHGTPKPQGQVSGASVVLSGMSHEQTLRVYSTIKLREDWKQVQDVLCSVICGNKKFEAA